MSNSWVKYSCSGIEPRKPRNFCPPKITRYTVCHVYTVEKRSSVLNTSLQRTAILSPNLYFLYTSYMYSVCTCRTMVQNYGLWNQIRVDKGREWYLMLFVQQKLSQHRDDQRKPGFLQTPSTQVRWFRSVVCNILCGYKTALINCKSVLFSLLIYYTCQLYTGSRNAGE